MRSSPVSAASPSAPAGDAALLVVAELGTTLAQVTSGPELLGSLQRHLKWVLPVSDLRLYVHTTPGAPAEIMPASGFAWSPLPGGLVEWVLRHDRILDIPDIDEAGGLPLRIDRKRFDGPRGALLILPLRGAEGTLGALALGATRRAAFAPFDRGLLNLIALQVGSALERVLLLRELDGAETIIASMARAVEAKDPYTAGHAARVTAYARTLAQAVHVPPDVLSAVEHAGPLHDVGKIGVSDAVLRKPGRLTEEEFRQIQRHAVIGDEICAPLQSLRRLRPAIRHHHERYDGRGYPDGLAGEAIPLEARILAVADSYDAMTSTRAYRVRMSAEEAARIIGRNEGPQWDPALAGTMTRLIASGRLDSGAEPSLAPRGQVLGMVGERGLVAG
jgi:hypothetical protein